MKFDFDIHLAIRLGTHLKKPIDKKKKGTETVDPNVQAPTVEAQPLTSPVSIKFKIHKNLTPNAHIDLNNTRLGDTDDETHIDDDQEELMTFVLTEDIFVEILSARLQVKFRFDSIRKCKFFFIVLARRLCSRRCFRQSRHVVLSKSGSSSDRRSQSD